MNRMSSNNPQSQLSLCFQSSDAVAVDDDTCSYTFITALTRKPVKVSLGSIEFPMVQYTIEKEWARLFLQEGIRITSQYRSLSLTETFGSEGSSTITEHSVEVAVPLHRNWGTISSGSSVTRIVLNAPHGLYTCTGSRLFHGVRPHQLLLLCSVPDGYVDLSSPDVLSSMTLVDPYAINVGCLADVPVHGSACVLCMQPFPTPAALCLFIQSALNQSGLRVKYSFTYDALTNHASIAALSFPRGSDFLRLRVSGSLGSIVGYPGSMHARTFQRNKLNISVMQAPCTATREQRLFNQAASYAPQFPLDADKQDDAPPLRLDAEAFSGWGYAELNEGWYFPCQRPNCIGQPYRISQELDFMLNKLFFPVAEHPPCVVFRDPVGALCVAQLCFGKYTPFEFVEQMEQKMQAAISKDAASLSTAFSLYYDPRLSQFTISCEWKRARTGMCEPARFSLEFGHPQSMSARRIGFEARPYAGCDSYVSASVQYLQSFAHPCSDRFASNTYKFVEVTMTRRMGIEATPPPMVYARMHTSHPPQDDASHRLDHQYELTTCLADDSLYVAGFQKDDMLWVMRVTEADHHSSDHSPPPRVPSPCVVLTTRGSTVTVVMSVSVDSGLTDAGSKVRVWAEPDPFNLFFSPPLRDATTQLQYSIRADIMGMDVGFNQGGVAPHTIMGKHVYNLEHCNYVKMLINNTPSKPSYTLQAVSPTCVQSLFTKLVFYPMYREERNIPKDIIFTSGESFPRFTIRFETPDGYAYRLHKHPFSFTLNFLFIGD